MSTSYDKHKSRVEAAREGDGRFGSYEADESGATLAVPTRAVPGSPRDGSNPLLPDVESLRSEYVQARTARREADLHVSTSNNPDRFDKIDAANRAHRNAMVRYSTTAEGREHLRADAEAGQDTFNDLMEKDKRQREERWPDKAERAKHPTTLTEEEITTRALAKSDEDCAIWAQRGEQMEETLNEMAERGWGENAQPVSRASVQRALPEGTALSRNGGVTRTVIKNTSHQMVTADAEGNESTLNWEGVSAYTDDNDNILIASDTSYGLPTLVYSKEG